MRRLIIILALVTILLIFLWQDPDPVLYRHGTPEVPGNSAFVIMNPFRDRTSERTADHLIRDIENGNCEEILASNRIAHAASSCEVLKHSRGYKLVDARNRENVGGFTRILVYQLPEANARLWIYFDRDEVGHDIGSISVIR